MDQHAITCESCSAHIPEESLLCRHCGAQQPGEESASLARDWILAGMILVILMVTSLVLYDIEWGRPTPHGEPCDTFEDVICEP